MPRIPLLVVLLAASAVVAVVWYQGTRDYDFLTPPSEAEIEAIKTRVAGEIVRPRAHEEAPVVPPAAPQEAEPVLPGAEEEPLPVIAAAGLPEPMPEDYWLDLVDMPAASFVDLASRLEAEAKLPEALVAWERVLDHSVASPEEQEIAVKAVQRIRETVQPPPLSKEAPGLTLKVTTPAKRLKGMRLVTTEVVKILEKAAFHQIRFKADVAAGKGEMTEISLSNSATPAKAEMELPADLTPEAARAAVLAACFKLAASTLALEEAASPVSQPAAGENPADSLAWRITRHAWSRLAELGKAP